MNILYFRFANSFLEPGFARLCWATTNTMPFRVTRLSCASSKRRVCWLWRSVLVRRSQRAKVRWARLSPVLTRWIPQPRILHPYPDARFAASHPR